MQFNPLDPPTGQNEVRMATPVQLNAHMKYVSELLQNRLSIYNKQTVFQSFFKLNQGQETQIRPHADNSGQQLYNTEDNVRIPSYRTAE
jgi:hypothetical protein